MKHLNDGDWMPYCGCLLLAAFVKIESCKTSIELCISSYWLQLFMHKFRDGLSLPLKMEAIFQVLLCLRKLYLMNNSMPLVGVIVDIDSNGGA